MDMKILFVTNTSEMDWMSSLLAKIGELGKLKVLSEKEATLLPSNQVFELVILDDCNLEQPVSDVVMHLNTSLRSPIIALAALPNWQDARGAILAGAIDYLPHTIGIDALFTRIQKIIRKLENKKPRIN